LWPKLSILEVSGPGEYIAETGFGFNGFSVYAWNSFENMGRQILSMTVSFELYSGLHCMPW